MNIKKSLVLGFSILLLGFSQSVYAHVVVKPAQVTIGSFQSFSIGVPVEKEIPTIGVRLVIPEGLDYVMPNVKPGWRISVTKDEATGKVTSIEWTDGLIPEGQRDDFAFSAKVPASEINIIWKAYQKYQDGTTVSWDMSPNSDKGDFSTSGPYSQTNVIDDLSVKKEDDTQSSTVFGIIAFVFSIIALGKTNRFSHNKDTQKNDKGV